MLFFGRMREIIIKNYIDEQKKAHGVRSKIGDKKAHKVQNLYTRGGRTGSLRKGHG